MTDKSFSSFFVYPCLASGFQLKIFSTSLSPGNLQGQCSLLSPVKTGRKLNWHHLTRLVPQVCSWLSRWTYSSGSESEILVLLVGKSVFSEVLYRQLVTCSCSVVHLWERTTAHFPQSSIEMWIPVDSCSVWPGRNGHRTCVVPWNFPSCSPRAVLSLHHTMTFPPDPAYSCLGCPGLGRQEYTCLSVCLPSCLRSSLLSNSLTLLSRSCV